MIIDTNVYSGLDRNNKAAVTLIANRQTVSLPFCVIGELWFGFLLGKNTKENQKRLHRFMSQDGVEVMAPSSRTYKVYGDLAVYCRKRGRALSNNDLWIAALAVEHDMPIATYDRDFLVLADRLSDKLMLLED